jgi:hypothetical protein
MCVCACICDGLDPVVDDGKVNRPKLAGRCCLDGDIRGQSDADRWKSLKNREIRRKRRIRARKALFLALG